MGGFGRFWAEIRKIGVFGQFWGKIGKNRVFWRKSGFFGNFGEKLGFWANFGQIWGISGNSGKSGGGAEIRGNSGKSGAGAGIPGRGEIPGNSARARGIPGRGGGAGILGSGSGDFRHCEGGIWRVWKGICRLSGRRIGRLWEGGIWGISGSWEGPRGPFPADFSGEKKWPKFPTELYIY